MKISSFTVVLLASLLAACSSIRQVDADVNAFSGPTAAVKGATYRFEQLPSQAKDPMRDKIEAMAETALAEAGLKRNDASARYSVEVGMVSEQFLSQPVILISRHSRFVMASDPLFWPPYVYANALNSTRYRYQLHLVMRDTATARIAYETTAELEVPWSDSINMIQPLLKAALRDYPVPPTGTQKVNVELGQAKAN